MDVRVTSPPTTCPGCGLNLPAIDGPTHEYIGASPACWAIYTSELLRPLFGMPGGMELVVDAYAAQHPGVPSPQSIQSVAVHLLSLYAVFERGGDPTKATRVRLRALRRCGVFTWLDPPAPGPLTIQDVAAAEDGPPPRVERARAYVRSVWEVWSNAHGATVAQWHEQFGRPERL